MSNQVPSTANQAGLSENAAGGLAYITIIPAIILLLVEPYNKSPYVRFHAWQCIFWVIGWIAIDVVLGISGMILPFFHLFAYGLYSMVSLAMLILWLIVLIKALNGERLKLPIIGDLAEKQAGR